jgi:hypothetical protein
LVKDIRPFDENASASEFPNSTPDARTTEFMNALRARISAQDEEQRQSWKKPARQTKPKPVTPSRPDWLNEPAPPTKSAPEPPKASKKNPAHSRKRSQRP